MSAKNKNIRRYSIGELIKRVMDKSRKFPNITTIYSVSNTEGLVASSEYHQSSVHSKDTSNYTVVRKNMFVYNPSRLNIGSIALSHGADGLVSPMYFVFEVKDESIILPEYLFLYLKSPATIEKIDMMKEEGARFRFPFDRWNKIEIDLPSIEKQKEVVDALDTMEHLLLNLEEELGARKKQYEYYLDNLLGIDDEKILLGDVCEENLNIKWKDVEDCKVYKYIDLSSVNRDLCKIERYQEITKNNAPSRAQQIVRCEDVLFGTTRPTLKRYCMVSEDFDGEICSTGFCILRANKDKVLPKYLFHIMSTTSFYKYVDENQEGAGYPAISNKKMMNYRMPLLSKEEQKRIVCILDKMVFLQENLQKEIELRKNQYEYYRDKLLNFKRI